jgi:hypothetical protein
MTAFTQLPRGLGDTAVKQRREEDDQRTWRQCRAWNPLEVGVDEASV